MPRVYICGAGASRFAGYPLSRDLWNFVLENRTSDAGGKDRDNSVINALSQVAQSYGAPQTIENLEALITFLDLADLGADPLHIARPDWRKVREQLLGMIADSFMWHEYCLQASIIYGRSVGKLTVDKDYAGQVLRKWSDGLNTGDAIITFNWDLLHDAALWRAKKWDYATGYGFKASGLDRHPDSPLLLLKLHGSVNWAQRDKNDLEPSIEHTMSFFQDPGADDQYRKGAGSWSRGRELVLPTYIKDISANHLLADLWDQAHTLLSHASEVVVVGFSLHRAEILARQMFGSALRKNRDLEEVGVVCSVAAYAAWDEFCWDARKRAKKVGERFEDWVQS